MSTVLKSSCTKMASKSSFCKNLGDPSMELSSKGTKMATFERVNFLRASLSPAEVHLYSCKGFLCEWDRERFLIKETPLLIERAPFLGNVTNTSLIIEPGNLVALPMF